MRIRIFGAKITPTRERTTPQIRPKAMVVWIERWSDSFSRAPKYRAITTPAPTAIPLKKPTRRKIRLPEELTAARALLPRKFPTMRESAML
jgi:hypothetical protein